MCVRFLSAVLLIFAPLVNALEFSGSVCGPEQEPVANIAVTLTTDDARTFQGRTDAEGQFTIDVEDQEVSAGTVNVDPIEVISSGYSRPKGYDWTVGLPTEIPLIELEEITPTLTFERRIDRTNCLRFDFDWVAGARPETLRTYCVERSDDMITWSIVMNVGMACPPVEFIDETATTEKNCFYRIRPLPSIWMPDLSFGDFGLIGDPAILPDDMFSFTTDWPGNIVLIDDEFPLQPQIPVIAPEIRLVEAEEAGE